MEKMDQLLVTHVDNFGPYLRLYGQLDKKHMDIVQSNIDGSMRSHVNNGEQLVLQIGAICLARRVDKFSRAKVLSFEGMECVRVQFIDYGDEQIVHIQELRSTKLPKMLENFPQQATTFILSGIFCNWKPYQIQEISAEICNKLFDFHIETEILNNIFARVFIDHQDLSEYLVTRKGMGVQISLDKMKEAFFHIIDKSPFVPNNNIKETSRGMMPARGLHSEQQNVQNVGYYPVVPMMTPQPLVLPRPRNCNNVPNSQPYNPTVLGIQNQSYRMPYKAPEPMLYSIKPSEKSPELQQTPTKRSVATFKSNTLMVGVNYDVYCCYVENGPCSFSIHLKSTEEDLNELMAELENIPLNNLTERPSLGMACIARFSEDAQLYRAVIMDIKPTSCQVAYVDYGNTEVVSFNDLYEIPPNLLEQKIFAVRFALSGYKELEPIDDCIKSTFTELVLHRNLKLKVMPLEGPPLVQYCELYEGQINILEALKIHKNRKLRYSAPEALHTSDVVVICYVESPKKFFIQKVSNTEAFEQLMDDLFLFCKKSRKSLNNLAKGTACAVKFENAWYRAEILGQSGNRVSIRHVDFGNERKVDPNQLCALTEGLVQFPPQAVQCCLKGFESAQSLSESATVQLEMLAESDDGDRRHFKCQIFKIESDGAILVNLIDENIRPELNLMKKLYKLSMPFNKYIGLEKEEFDLNAAPKAIQSYKDKHDTVLNSTTINNDGNMHQQNSSNWDSGNVHQHQSTDWEAGSSGSGETKDTRNSRDNRPPRREYQDNKPNRDNYRREQPYSTFKSNNLPPRFQKQQNDNRRYRDNNSFDKTRNTSSETSGKFSQSSRNSYHKVESEQDWSSEAITDTPKEENSSYHQLESDVNWPSEVDTGTAKEEFVPFESSFSTKSIDVPSHEESIICWWISPHQFYTHLKSRTTQFESMMKEMQKFYKNKSPANSLLPIGSSVIARYREDNVLYRAKVTACNQTLRKYRVEFVDFGNQSTVGENDIYQVERRFIDQPVMANLCAFENIISNFDLNYITNKVEQYIKPGTTVTCEYLKKENNLYYVNVDIKGESLKELMINDGLLSSLDTDMKLETLSGQQIKAKIISVQDLLNFKINIEGCSLNLQCCYNDIKFVKSYPHLSSEFKTYEGISCIVDVLDVTEEKILMLQPHIALFTKALTSSLICDYPLPYQSLNVKVVYVETANKIYIQPVVVEDTVAQILDDMYTYYDANGEILSQIQTGIFCAANSSDGNWYRARIISVMDESIEVYYIDYGNTEIINSTDKIKVLEETFYNSSALAVGVYIPVKCIDDKEEAVINEIRSLTEGYELSLHILECYKYCWITDVSSNGYSLLNVLEDKSLIQGRDIEYVKDLIDNVDASTLTQRAVFEPHDIVHTNADNNLVQSDQIPSTVTEMTITQENYTNNMIPAYLSHCDNPGRFFLHTTEDFDELTKLQDNIQIVAGSLPPLMSIVTGASCIALYSVDSTWYRAKIIDNEIMAVQFIDYGNTDVITDSSYIKEMNEAFANIKAFAIPCCLAAAPKGTIDWVDEANSVFNESYEKTVYFDFITKDEKKNFVNLVIDGENMTEKLIADGLARQLEIVKSGENCFISHINNLTDFYIQMEADADVLELIAEHLAEFEHFPVIKNCAEGTICAALFPDDGEWYRARVLTNTTDGMEVLFIDFGNKSITTEARQISEEIAHLPPLTKKCTLKIPESILGWSDLAEARFSELSAMGQTVFVVQLVEPGEHAVIDLFVGEKNILDDLEPLCDKKPLIGMDSSTISDKERKLSLNEPDLRNVVISHINSPNDFYAQFTTNNEQLSYITDALNGEQIFEKLENPEKDQICCAVFPDDGAIYRAKILSITDQACSVIFIDFGNVSSCTELFILPDDLKSIEPLSTHCSLEMSSSNFDFSSDIACENFNMILEPYFSETIQIEIVNQMLDPWIVRMFCKNSNINKELMKSLEEIGAEKNGNEVFSEPTNEIIQTSGELQKQQEETYTDVEQTPLSKQNPNQEIQAEVGTESAENLSTKDTSEYTNLEEERALLVENPHFTDDNKIGNTLNEQKLLGAQIHNEFNSTEIPDQIEYEIDNAKITTPSQTNQIQNNIESIKENLTQTNDKHNENEHGGTPIDPPLQIDHIKNKTENYEETTTDRKHNENESTEKTTAQIESAKEILNEILLTIQCTEESTIDFSAQPDKNQNENASAEKTTIVLPTPQDIKQSATGRVGEIIDEIITSLPAQIDQLQDNIQCTEEPTIEFSSEPDEKQNKSTIAEKITIVLPKQTDKQSVTDSTSEIIDEILMSLPAQLDQRQDEIKCIEELTMEFSAEPDKNQNENASAEKTTIVLPTPPDIKQSATGRVGQIIDEIITSLPAQIDQLQDNIQCTEEPTIEFSSEPDEKQNKSTIAEKITIMLPKQTDKQSATDTAGEIIDEILMSLPVQLDQLQDEIKCTDEANTVLSAQTDEKQNGTERAKETIVVATGSTKEMLIAAQINPLYKEIKNSEETISPKSDKKENETDSSEKRSLVTPELTVEEVIEFGFPESHFSEFYIQSQCKSHTLKKITNLLDGAEVYDELTSPEIDSVCAALSPDDGAYYRAKIVSLDGKSLEVILIDYGNKMNTTDVRVLPENLKFFEPIAEKCSLAEIQGVDFNDETTTNVFNLLMESYFGEVFQIQEIESSNKQIKTVKLFVEDLEIGAKLRNILSVKNAKPKVIDNVKNVLVSHTNSPNDFYIQFSDDIPILDKISQSLVKAIDFPILLDPSESSDICAALFLQDKSFYRAKILSVQERVSEVLFIDFGKKCFTEDLRILPNDLKNIQTISYHCALQNLSDSDFWSEMAVKSFCSLIETHMDETYQVQIVEKSTDPWIIKLYYQNQDLGKQLAESLNELSGQEESTEIWDTVEDNTASFTKDIVDSLVENAEIIDSLIENVPINSSMCEINICDEKDSSNLNTSNVNAMSTHAYIQKQQVFSSTELDEKLWKGHPDVTIPLSDYNKNRAVSTSNISQRHNFVGSSSSLLNIRNENTRSKSSDCLNITAEK